MRAIVVVGAVLFAASAGAATRQPKVTAWIQEANRLYLDGKYREAADLLLKAEAAEPDARLVYNIARAYDQAGDLALALDYYQRFVKSAGADAALSKRAPGLSIVRIQRILDEEQRLKAEADAAKKAAAEKPPPPPPPKVAPETAEQRRVRELQAAREQAALEGQQRDHANRMFTTYVLAGVAGATLTTGIIFSVSAGRAKSQFDQATTAASKNTWKSTTTLRAGLADASYIVAIASAVAAVWVYPDKKKLPFLSVGPLATPTGGGAWAEVRF